MKASLKLGKKILEVNAYEIKTALMAYYRFKRGFVCVDECGCTGYEISDVLVDTGKYIIDIEIKISKSDLIKGEAKKKKHYYYKNAEGKKKHPNKFYLCVPRYLLDEAKEWVENVNKNYGIIIYNPPKELRFQRDLENSLYFIKKAQKFNSYYDKEYFKEMITKRLASSLTNIMLENILKKSIKSE